MNEGLLRQYQQGLAKSQYPGGAHNSYMTPGTPSTVQGLAGSTPFKSGAGYITPGEAGTVDMSGRPLAGADTSWTPQEHIGAWSAGINAGTGLLNYLEQQQAYKDAAPMRAAELDNIRTRTSTARDSLAARQALRSAYQ